jgi:hypothetical protein
MHAMGEEILRVLVYGEERRVELQGFELGKSG